MILNELFEARDPEQLAINAALAALHRRATSKGDRQSLHGYAFDIVKSFRLGMDARQLAKLYRERYSNNENISENKVNYSAPNFEYEWKEALRYPEFQKIGKEAWIELASKGRAVTIRSAKDINNTDAADPDSFASLDKTKQGRALDQLKSGTVEMPIVAVYSDGWKELVGGNTRLTAMLAQNGEATVWQFEVPDEVAELAEMYNEAWSEKYKRSINCSNPRGFSQRAHCAARKKS